jgi:hypothetical protein
MVPLLLKLGGVKVVPTGITKEDIDPEQAD